MPSSSGATHLRPIAFSSATSHYSSITYVRASFRGNVEVNRAKSVHP
jgi:hypothetical protein